MKYRNETLLTLAEILETLEDPRDNRGKRHRLLDIFILTVYGSLWGHTDFVNMAAELKYCEKFFTELLGLENGIPSHDTFSAVFSIIDPAEFLECFIIWIAGIVNSHGKHVAFDGKAVRAACEKVRGKKVPYLVNAFMVETGICIGQIRVDEKTNEIKGIPELLEWLDLDGAVVTIDAIGCQKEIAELLIGKKADFVLPVKENQPTLHDDILLEIHTRIAERNEEEAREKMCSAKGIRIGTPISDCLDIFIQLNHNHSRIERRTYYVWNDATCVDREEWPHVKSIGMAVRERMAIKRNEEGEILEEAPAVETQTYIMSREMNAAEFACYARGHWGIENSLHWVLDDYFREDRCTARAGKATENLGLMRKIIYNLAKLDEDTAKMSMKGRQVYYRNNPAAIMKLLFEVIPSRY